MTRYLFIFFIASFLSHLSHAHKQYDDPHWDGEVHLGGVLNTGNTDNKHLNGEFDFTYKRTPWEAKLNISGEWTRTDDETKAKNAEFESQLQHHWHESNFIFGNYKVVWNPFATFDLVHTAVVGIGHHLIATPTMELTVQIGPGVRTNRVAGAKEHRNEGLIHTNNIFEYKFNDQTSFKQTLSIESGDFNTLTKTVSSVRTRMVHNVSLELSYTTEHNSKIPDDSKNRKNLDTTTKISLVYEFM